MTHFRPFVLRFGSAPLLLAPTRPVLAQTLVITGIVPTANARAAAPGGPLTVSFNQALTPGLAAALKVYRAQWGGLRSRGATPVVVSGNDLSFVPGPTPFAPGETVGYTVTTAAAGSGGSLGRARVGQFTAAPGGATLQRQQPTPAPR